MIQTVGTTCTRKITTDFKTHTKLDFTKLLQHCRDEHGVEVDTSVLMKELVITIFRHFDRKHGLTFHDTEIWDIFETLQNQPKPGNPPPIVAIMKERVFENIKSGEEMEPPSWYSQEGVLLSNREALAIVEFCERANVPEQLPDANGFPTGFFDMDGDMICVGDVLEYPNDPGQSRYTVIFKDATFRQKYHHWEKGREDFPALNQTLLVNRKIVARAKRVEQLPEPVIYPRPDWESIDTKFNYVAVDAGHDVYAFTEKPQFKSRGWQDGGVSEYLHELNFSKMLWKRPENQKL